MRISPTVPLALAVLFTACASAQEIKTVAQCRSYRDAWMTSAQDDIQHLSIKVLLHRAEQMTACGRDIDTSPVNASQTKNESMLVVIAELRYPILAANYYREAFNRAAAFMESKHLTSEFIADDQKQH